MYDDYVCYVGPEAETAKVHAYWEGLVERLVSELGGKVVARAGTSSYQGWGSIAFIFARPTAEGLRIRAEASKIDVSAYLAQGEGGIDVAWDVLETDGSAYGVINWAYGTCGGCDLYMDLEDEERRQAFLGLVEVTKTEAEAIHRFNVTKSW